MGNRFLLFLLCHCADFDKSSQVLEQHFVEQLSIYHRVCIINTLNQTGQERKLVDAYEEHLLKINTPDISYVAFDFHKIWLVSLCNGYVVSLCDGYVVSLCDGYVVSLCNGYVVSL